MFEDVICELLHLRIVDLLPLGLNKLWLKLKGDNIEKLSTLLGYNDFIFDEFIQYSSLSTADGRICFDRLSSLLITNNNINKIYNMKTNNHDKFIRFKSHFLINNTINTRIKTNIIYSSDRDNNIY